MTRSGIRARTGRRPSSLAWAGLAAAGAAVVVLGLVWIPWIVHNHVPERAVPSAAVDAARQVPAAAVLEELGRHDLGVTLHWSSPQELRAAADKLLEGRIELPGFDPVDLKFPFQADTMAVGGSKWQLFVHSFGVPRVLLAAYALTQRAEFLDEAVRYVVVYDEYERSAWRPGGFLWNDEWQRFVRNDHAVSARVSVLAEFWRVYRASPAYSADVGETVLRMASRYANLLADPARFTVATNHGVMQNLAVCQLELAFPTLGEAKELCKLAFERFGEQLQFFVSEDGFVLEHSPGYQGFDLTLIGLVFRALGMSGIGIPDEWRMKYAAAVSVYGDLRRPDGSLPVFGDTYGVDPSPPRIVSFDSGGTVAALLPGSWSPTRPTLLSSVAGYVSWWDGLDAWPEAAGMSHTTLGWSYFPGMAHKHADEMSVDIWAAGSQWWANAGYWPYDDPRRIAAESWEGSNAPHLIGEPADSARETRLRYHGRSAGLALADLERRGPGGYGARRQVVLVGGWLWLVLDASHGVPGGRTRVIWTTPPSVRLTEAQGAGAYTLADPGSGRELRAYFVGAAGNVPRGMQGSSSPFAGWSALGGVVSKASAVVVEQPADGSWSLAAWSLTSAPRKALVLADAPRVTHWESPDRWTIELPLVDGMASLERRSSHVSVQPPSGERRELVMQDARGLEGSRSAIRKAFAAASEKYGTADKSLAYRIKVSGVLVAALGLCLASVAMLRRLGLRWTPAAGAALGAGWLMLCYFFIFVRVPLL